MPPRREQVSSWNDFHDLVARLPHSPLAVGLLFRGQPRANWRLPPSLAREALGLTREQTLAIEQMALNDFRRQAHLHLPPRVVPDDDNDVISWWLTMQHYGAPTRLLDWSKSPYVALYFAVISELDDDGALWVVDGAAASRLMGEPLIGATGPDHVVRKPNAPDTMYFIEPKHQTERMVAQQTAFTLCAQVQADHQDVFDRVFAAHEEIYVRAEIPAGAKAEFIIQLQRMNITASALFPGVDGLGKSVAEFVRVARIALDR